MVIPRGWFVEVDDERRFGKVVDSSLDHVEVEFFGSIRARQTDIFPTGAVTRSHLSRQTRVYFTTDHGERWVMGRVRRYHIESDGSVTYEVRSPNNVDRDVSERHLFARCYGPGGDPAEVLSLGAAEAQIWHDARWSARDALSRLRSAAGGLEGLSSASVELVPHQADAVQRVLLDPLQRYLLADEVGLGKTIEAGAIIAQTILDDPRRRVLVLAPDALIGQWKNELRRKFGLDASSWSNLAVAPYSDGHLFAPPHLLVVDEAHRCASNPAIHGCIAELAAGAEKLLLLTATPVIGNEEAFLELLRWLDQARWGTETHLEFERHVRASQEYGRLLLGLRPDASPFLLKQRIASARATFPDDDMVSAIADSFTASDSSAGREAACADLREHIADTYRIYHRLVRARRSDLDGWEFQARRNATVREEGYDEDAAGEAASLLEDWRASALLATDASPALEDELAARYVGLLECMGRGVTLLSTIDLAPIFEEEEELLDGIRSVGRSGDASERLRFVSEVVERQLSFLLKASSQPPKLVVFTSDDAMQLATLLRSRLGEKSVLGPGGDLDGFRSDASIVVGVFDRPAEEGLNLHFADAIIHADLPFSVQRIEQRIGRLDRFGRSKGPIRHAVVVPGGEDDSPWSAWLDLLRSGIEIFDRPASDIQFVLESVEREIRRRLFKEGGTGLGSYINELKLRIERERQTLDEQYALDQLALSRESARQLVERMEEAEADEAALARQVGGLMRLLQFEGRMDGDVFALAWTHDTLLPERPWKPVFEDALKRPMTWRRRVAEGRSDIGLLRPGAALIEALERLLDWDDRGSAFATWRERPDWGAAGEERLVFRLCWVVGPQPIAGTGLLIRGDKAGLRRQAQAALPPWTEVQHLGGDLAPILDGALLDVLFEPYRPEGEGSDGRDYNLGSRVGWLDRVVDPGTFKRLCRDVRDAGLARLEAGEVFRDRVARAVQSVQRDNARIFRRARAHLGAGGTFIEGAAEGDEVLDAVSRPVSRLDSVGVFVIAGHAPRKVGP